MIAGTEAEPHRQLERETEADGHRFSVQEPIAVPRLGLEGVGRTCVRD